MIPVQPEIARRAHVGSMDDYRRLYQRSLADPAGFWREQAESLSWFHPPLQTFDADPVEVDFSWFGGMLPLLATAMVARAGNIYYGLWYPIVVALMTFVIGLLFLRETKDRSIHD